VAAQHDGGVAHDNASLPVRRFVSALTQGAARSM
jgi:hypothetical protein